MRRPWRSDRFGNLVSVTAIARRRMAHGRAKHSKFPQLKAYTTITPENVGALKQKWVFTTGGDVSATPAVYDGTVYFPDWAGNFYAVNATTGALVWSKTVSSWTGVPGDYARDDPAIAGDTLILGDQAGKLATWTQAGGLTGAGARVIAVNRLTGALIWSTQVDSFPTAFITGSPVIYNGVVYVGVASHEEAHGRDGGLSLLLLVRKRRGAQRSDRNNIVANLYGAQPATAAVRCGVQRPSSTLLGTRFMSAPEIIFRFRKSSKPASPTIRTIPIAPPRTIISIPSSRLT